MFNSCCENFFYNFSTHNRFVWIRILKHVHSSKSRGLAGWGSVISYILYLCHLKEIITTNKWGNYNRNDETFIYHDYESILTPVSGLYIIWIILNSNLIFNKVHV